MADPKQHDAKRKADSYARLYDDILENDKVAELIPSAFGLYTALIVYCHRNDTDGVVPSARAERLLNFVEGDYQAALDNLLAARLVEKVRSSLIVHDYLLHNASHAERNAKSNAAKLAAQVRWGDAKRIPDANGITEGIATGNARFKDKDKAVQLQVTEPSLLDVDTDDEVARVFVLWRDAFKRAHTTRLDDKRRRVIAKALKDYGWEGVVECINGYTHDPWPERQRRNDITLLLRDAEHIEDGRALMVKAREAVDPAPRTRTLERAFAGPEPRGIGEPDD
jgi:hypothetical protein